MNFQIELTNHCNLQCIECPHRFMKRIQTTMSDEVFYKILLYIKDIKPQTVIMHKDGEPLIHPKLFDYMKEIDSIYTTKFDIYTNGILLKPEFVSKLGELNSVVSILLSFHFYGFNETRVDYTKTNKALLDILADCPKNVQFVFVTHVTDLIEKDELDRWKAFWDGVMKERRALTAVHANPHINPWTGLIKQKNTIKFDGCPYADGQHMFFGVTGNILACCMDLEEQIVFGNVMYDSPDFIMFKRNEFYKDLNNDIIRELCSKCMA